MDVWMCGCVESLLRDVLQIDVEHNWREEATLANSQ